MDIILKYFVQKMENLRNIKGKDIEMGLIIKKLTIWIIGRIENKITLITNSTILFEATK